MPAGKTLMLTATGVIVLGVGGYVGAQAVVGNEVKKALSQTFAQLDDSLSWYASDVTIDKSLFKTTASATIGMESVENANAQVNLLVDHGVINSPITGTIHPNEQFLRGDIDVDLVATRSSVTGQLTADSLSGVELDGNLQDLIVDLDLEDQDVWRVDGQAREIVINNENDSVRIVSPRFANHSQEASSLIHQYLEIPRVEFLAQGISVYMDGVELEAESESVGDSQIVNSGGHFSVADIGADDTSIGSLSLDMDAKNWDMSAFQAFQEAYAPLTAMRAEYEESEVRGDELEERALLIQAIESGYDVLVANPSIAFQPLQAHVVLPMLGIDFNPRLSADIRFDGEALSKDALYIALWDSRLPLPEQLHASQDVMSTEEAQAYLQNRVSLDISVTTPPQMVLSLIPMPFSLLIDPDFEEQRLIWQDGSLTVNGEEVM
ncbi:DUF945 family protein [Vreelandella populi]|uniref:DUF945 family protein n=1 Tax=Vreelandella populi TaxID=2498858 RepID=A0A3S0X0H3_9GAMM|nr:DUF945 family protein [Halomonas populi]RUR36518.1 DUF945 family protein [Halomonas populi]RUR44979.1 DUF945 family protein [Halomonas populi]RUR51316.1 DUF945 family protein [Halomonas populi]